MADRLHSVAIHLLRTVRRTDRETGLSPARLSALSVLVFGGERTPSELAAAEQVSAPTMTRLVQGLQAEGMIRRRRDRDDGRVVRLLPTARARRILERARAARLDALLRLLGDLPPEEIELLESAAGLLEAALSRARPTVPLGESDESPAS